MADWHLQDAKDRFDTLVEAALSGEPQRVDRYGRRVVVLSELEYERLRRRDGATTPTFAELLLEMPQDDGEFERLPSKPRDTTFD